MKVEFEKYYKMLSNDWLMSSALLHLKRVKDNKMNAGRFLSLAELSIQELNRRGVCTKKLMSLMNDRSSR